MLLNISYQEFEAKKDNFIIIDIRSIEKYNNSRSIKILRRIKNSKMCKVLRKIVKK